MLNHYGVVTESGSARMTFGGHLRALGDWLGLDGEVGLQGTFSHDGEGKDGVAGSGEVPDGSGSDGGGSGGFSSVEGDFDGDGTPDPVDPTSGVYPVIIDLDKDGVEVSTHGVSFDWDDDGYREAGAWASADDGFLVYDLGDSLPGFTARELSFGLWTDANDTDLEALANAVEGGRRVFDVNGDKKLSAADGAAWLRFKVWQDRNQNGEVDSGEVQTLESLGISEIRLTYDDGSEYGDTEDDVSVGVAGLHGLATLVRGGEVVEGGVGDVSLRYSDLGVKITEANGIQTIEFEGQKHYRYAMAGAGGYGNTIDLDANVLDGARGNDAANLLSAYGHSRDVFLEGNGGNDTLKGGAGDDRIAGGAGADALYGQDGNDWLFIDDLDTVINGGRGWDIGVITSTRGVSLNLSATFLEGAVGGDGHDTITAEGLLDDIGIQGGAGSDRITGSGGDDNLTGDSGADVISGGVGGDRIDGGNDNDRLYGNSGDDTVVGGHGADLVSGSYGDDVLFGGGHADTIFGHSHDDRLFGGTNNDSLNGGEGDDYLDGGTGHDTLVFWRGDDTLVGGAGNDTFRVDDEEHSSTRYWGWAVFNGGTGNDTLVLEGAESDYSFRKIGGNQWQAYRGNETNSARIILDLLDIETVTFSAGGTRTLSTDTTLDTQDAYVRRERADYIGDDVARFGSSGFMQEDTLFGWMGDDALLGHEYARHEAFDGGTGRDTIETYGGNDTIQASSGADAVYGGEGADSIIGDSGGDTLVGGLGADTVYGGTGSDAIYGEEGADKLYGGDGGDLLVGGADADTLVGGAGADQLVGGDQNDWIDGETGADTLSGEGGDDYLDGGEGADRLFGGDGHDRLYGGSGFNLLSGEAGNDRLYGGEDDDQIAGGDGNDEIYGGTGRDVMMGGAGADSLYGGAGITDLASFEGSNAAVTVNLLLGTASGGHAAGDSLGGIEQLLGSSHGDRLNGNDIDNVLHGGDGNDRLNGEGAHDDLFGGDGNDVLTGGDGFDRLAGGEGTDSLYGGADLDTLNGNDGNDVLSAGLGNDLLFGEAGHDSLSGDGGNDTLYGGSGNDTLDGGDGADAMRGGSGDDTIIFTNGDVFRSSTSAYDIGGSGRDTLVIAEGSSFRTSALSAYGFEVFKGAEGGEEVTGNDGEVDYWMAGNLGADTLTGNNGNDSLYGGSGADELRGGSGADYINGGNHNDTLYGGGGADTFAFGKGSDQDRIAGFSDNVDALRLYGFEFTTASQALTYARNVDGDVVFDFGNGDILTVVNTTKAALLDDLIIG